MKCYQRSTQYWLALNSRNSRSAFENKLIFGPKMPFFLANSFEICPPPRHPTFGSELHT